MTFDEWFVRNNDGDDSGKDIAEYAWKAGAASRNAEVAELKKELYAISVAIDDPRTDLTMTMVEVITDQHKERDHLREQVKMLRDVVGHVAGMRFSIVTTKMCEAALAATEPK